jgi:hypothetical protein
VSTELEEDGTADPCSDATLTDTDLTVTDTNMRRCGSVSVSVAQCTARAFERSSKGMESDTCTRRPRRGHQSGRTKGMRQMSASAPPA